MRRAVLLSFALSTVLICAAVLAGSAAGSRVPAPQSDREIIANLATGRVIICVARDALIVGAVSEQTEAGAHGPLFVPMNGGHVAVLLGAVEWIVLNSGTKPVRLDAQWAEAAQHGGHGTYALEENEAGDIETPSLAFLETLRAIGSHLHHPLGLKSNEPLIQVVVAGYEKDYGPEAWLVSYSVDQHELKNDYWDTLIQRPSYVQLYPPEKGEPRTIMEVRYPPEIKGSTLAQLLGQNDPRLIPVRNADAKIAQAAQQILDGESNKAAPDPAIAFVRGAMMATITPDERPALAVLREGDRFDWVIPSPETLKPADENRDPNAPTLRAPHHQ